jgi:hypothetical protein
VWNLWKERYRRIFYGLYASPVRVLAAGANQGRDKANKGSGMWRGGDVHGFLMIVPFQSLESFHLLCNHNYVTCYLLPLCKWYSSAPAFLKKKTNLVEALYNYTKVYVLRGNYLCSHSYSVLRVSSLKDMVS